LSFATRFVLYPRRLTVSAPSGFVSPLSHRRFVPLPRKICPHPPGRFDRPPSQKDLPRQNGLSLRENSSQADLYHSFELPNLIFLLERISPLSSRGSALSPREDQPYLLERISPLSSKGSALSPRKDLSSLLERICPSLCKRVCPPPRENLFLYRGISPTGICPLRSEVYFSFLKKCFLLPLRGLVRPKGSCLPFLRGLVPLLPEGLCPPLPRRTRPLSQEDLSPPPPSPRKNWPPSHQSDLSPYQQGGFAPPPRTTRKEDYFT
jgi:hypothetical protein